MSTQLDGKNEYVYPRVIDWNQVLIDITEHGLRYSAICEVLNITWSTHQRWRTGSEPGFAMGTAILAVHKRYCGDNLNRQRILEAKQ